MLEPLRAEGYDVSWVSDGATALSAASAVAHDLVILDAKLPDRNALAVCRELRSIQAGGDVPVVFVSASNAESDRVLCLEQGAEDYVVRPFSTRELLLRIRAILRRRQPRARPLPEAEEWGGLRLERDAHRLWVEGREVALTAMEWKAFVYLFDGRERVRTRAELLRDVWSRDEGEDTRSVDVMMGRLRTKLRAARVRLRTVRGVGFQLSLPPCGSS